MLGDCTLAAKDTTSDALAITLQLLSEHLDVQERLRQEILDASQGQDLDYDALVSLPYLDAVCRESLRLCVLQAHAFRPTLTHIDLFRRHAPVTTVFRE